MKTLNEPVYEVNNKSKFYEMHKTKKDSNKIINEITLRISKLLKIEVEEFVYYNANKFGFYDNDKGFVIYKDKLTKNSDKNGVFCFKKTTEEYKQIKPMMLEIDKIRNGVDSFAAHTIFGMNNIQASQWIGDKLFFGVKDLEYAEDSIKDERTVIEYGKDVAERFEYKKYLSLVVEEIN